MERARRNDDDSDAKPAIVVINPPEGGHHLRKGWWCPALAGSLLVAAANCSEKPSEPQEIVASHAPVGSWQGRGTATVGDIPSETGRFRIVWRTSNESPAGTGTFKLTLRSAISGRTLGVVADHKGVGTGTAEYDEGPRTYDFLVESTSVDWSFTVEETSGAFANGSPSSVPGKR